LGGRQLQVALENRATVQTAQAELPAEILSWRQRERDQDKDLLHPHCQPVDDCCTKKRKESVGVLQSGQLLQNPPVQLFNRVFRKTRQGLAQRRAPAIAVLLILKGAYFLKIAIMNI